jgi:hypothetical protein
VFQVTDGPSAGQPFHPLDGTRSSAAACSAGARPPTGWRFSGWLETGKGQAKSPLMGAIGVYIMGWCDIPRPVLRNRRGQGDGERALSDAVAMCRATSRA